MQKSELGRIQWDNYVMSHSWHMFTLTSGRVTGECSFSLEIHNTKFTTLSDVWTGKFSMQTMYTVAKQQQKTMSQMIPQTNPFASVPSHFFCFRLTTLPLTFNLLHLLFATKMEEKHINPSLNMCRVQETKMASFRGCSTLQHTACYANMKLSMKIRLSLYQTLMHFKH